MSSVATRVPPVAGASVTVSLAGEDIFSISGDAAFSISPVDGFRLQSFRVSQKMR